MLHYANAIMLKYTIHYLKTFQFYWPADVLSLRRPVHTEASPVSLMNSLFKTIFQVTLSYWLQLCLEESQTMCRKESCPVSLTNDLFNTIIFSKTFIMMQSALPPRRLNNEWAVLLSDIYIYIIKLCLLYYIMLHYTNINYITLC